MDAPVKALFPEVMLSAGRSMGPVLVNHELVTKRVLVIPRRRGQHGLPGRTAGPDPLCHLSPLALRFLQWRLV